LEVLLSHVAVISVSTSLQLRQLAKTLHRGYICRKVLHEEQQAADLAEEAFGTNGKKRKRGATGGEYVPARSYAEIEAQLFPGRNTVWEVSHLCGNRYCIRSSHLVIERDGKNASRMQCFKGQRRCEHKPACILRGEGDEEEAVEDEDEKDVVWVAVDDDNYGFDFDGDESFTRDVGDISAGISRLDLEGERETECESDEEEEMGEGAWKKEEDDDEVIIVEKGVAESSKGGKEDVLAFLSMTQALEEVVETEAVKEEAEEEVVSLQEGAESMAGGSIADVLSVGSSEEAVAEEGEAVAVEEEKIEETSVGVLGRLWAKFW
jgi:hypothetical protein